MLSRCSDFYFWPSFTVRNIITSLTSVCVFFFMKEYLPLLSVIHSFYSFYLIIILIFLKGHSTNPLKRFQVVIAQPLDS